MPGPMQNSIDLPADNLPVDGLSEFDEITSTTARGKQPGFWLRQRYVWRLTYRRFYANGGSASAGNIAFLTMLAIFPFFLFLLSLSGMLGQTERGLEAISFAMDILPPEIAEVLNGPVNSLVANSGAGYITFSVLIAIWTSSNGVEAARDVVVRAYGYRYAPAAWLRRLESLGLVIAAALANIIAMVAIVIVPLALNAVTQLFPDFISSNLSELLRWASFLIAPLILFLAIAALYRVLTPRAVKRQRVLPGTLVSLVFLLGTAQGFSIYLGYANNYDVTYGSLAGVIITQLFCFIVALGFVFGAELNAAYARVGSKGRDKDTRATESEN